MALWEEILLGSGVIGLLALLALFILLVVTPIGIWFALRRMAIAHEQLVKVMAAAHDVVKADPQPVMTRPEPTPKPVRPPREPFDWNKKTGPLRHVEWAALVGLAALIMFVAGFVF